MRSTSMGAAVEEAASSENKRLFQRCWLLSQRRTQEWLERQRVDGEQRVGTIGTLRICLEELWQCQQVAKDWIGYSSIHTAQMAIDSCNGVHLKRGCENLPLVVRWIDLVPRWWSPASPLFARCNAAFAGDGETLQRYVFHLLHLWLHYLMQLLLYWKWRNLWTRRFSFLCRLVAGRRNFCFGWWNAQQEISHLL